MPLSGSKEFCEDLLNRHFSSASNAIDEISGYEINGHALRTRGFEKPILISRREGLRIQVPPSSFSPSDLLKYINPKHNVDVIDVRAQEEIQMNLEELVDHFVSTPRTRLLNMLSLEFSQTKLSTLVQPPHVVSELSLITNCWVSDSADDEHDDVTCGESSVPSVQKYCLLSMQGSYTDFHIDFGGSCVWYHVLWGEKIFYLIPPTPQYFTAYWKWSFHPEHRTIFFPDILQKKADSTCSHSGHLSPVYELRVLPGQTILLPSGWIHAVYTPSDCLVFGGNFLTEVHIPSQLKVYRMEQKSETPIKFQFPNFEKVHWFAADRIVGRLTNALHDERDITSYEVAAVRSLSKTLPRWYERRRSLPMCERSYYLPSRSTLELPWTCLIDRLCDLSRAFDAAHKKNKVTRLLQFTATSESESSTPTVHSVQAPFQSEEFTQSDEQCILPQCKEKQQSTSRSRAAGAGLGWMPDRSAKRKWSENVPIDSAHPVTDDPDVLGAVPELSNSRLVGDHYFLTLSDSEEDDEKDSSPPVKQAKSSRGRRKQTRDPDPTWSASSSSTKKSATRLFKGCDRLLSPTGSKSSLPTFSLTGGGLHPLLHQQTPSTSTQSQQCVPTAPDSQSRPSTKQSKTKSNTTVRQRLAKRLGL